MDDRGRDAGDGGGRRVAIAEWDAVLDHLEQFCESATVDVENRRATCEFANARLAIGADGTVEAGMPLHAFERSGVESVVFDHERGELTVEADHDDGHLRYTFRRP